MKMKKIIPLFLLIPTLLTAAELVDRIIAVVGDEVITLSDVRNRPRYGKGDPLETLIRERLLVMEMDRLGVRVTNDELADGIQEVLRRNRMELEELKREIERKGKAFDQYKEELRQEIRRMKFLGQVVFPRIKISEDEVTKRARSNSSEEERLKIRQKLVEERLSQELEVYLDEVRGKTYVEIKK